MIEEISLPQLDACVPIRRETMELLDEADQRIDAFTRSQRPTIDNFVVCDFRLVDRYLGWIVEHRMMCGNGFCEWGSGFGVVTMLAAMHGLNAHGIEVEQSLIQQSEQLASDFEIRARFAHGSFVPDGGESLIEYQEDIDHIDVDSYAGYDELGMDVADFDLFFAFPWPGEHRLFESVFEHYGCDGALLLTYRGIEQLTLQRKIA